MMSAWRRFGSSRSRSPLGRASAACRDSPTRTVSDADVLLGQHPAEDGLRYLNWQPSTDPNHLSPEDLAVTILINSRAGPAAFRSAQNHGHVLDIGKLPDVPLEETSAGERAQVASFIAAVTDWDGSAASVATKVLHG